jgi:hypothetical protein
VNHNIPGKIPGQSKDPRHRPYSGQPHTDYGERGKTLVEGLTMRDIQDCYVRAVALSAGHLAPEMYEVANQGKLEGIDLYSIDLNQLDPGAIGQNLGCEIERMMGIFPNVPELEEGTDSTEPQPNTDSLEEQLGEILTVLVWDVDVNHIDGRALKSRSTQIADIYAKLTSQPLSAVTQLFNKYARDAVIAELEGIKINSNWEEGDCYKLLNSRIAKLKEQRAKLKEEEK